MRNNALLLIALFVLFTSAIIAQTNVDIRRKEFKSSKAGFKEAWEHVKKGDDFFVSKGIFYKYALDEYLIALDFNSSNAELNYKAGVSALLSDRKDVAADLFLKSFNLKRTVTDDILLVTGRALQFAGRYDEAIGYFNDYLNSPAKKKDINTELARKGVAECTSATEITKDILNVIIENAGPDINSSADDYSEVVSSEGNVMYFASRRETPGSSDFYSDYKFDENIFVSRLSNGTWEPAVSAGKKLTSKYCETPLYISKFNDNLYIYEGSENFGDIKLSVSKAGKWGLPGLIRYKINTSGRETSFTFSPDENEIWYVTEEGRDNFGGKDIYFIRKSENGKWSKPVNAGSNINTSYDEESVRLSRNGDTLYFSSRGHNTIGGFDVFFSVREGSGKWSKAVNLGYPVNTSFDEIFYYPSPVSPKKFWFASNRSGGFGYFDIYSGTFGSSTADSAPAAGVIPFVSDSTVNAPDVIPDTLLKPAAVLIDSITSNLPSTSLISDSIPITAPVASPAILPTPVVPVTGKVVVADTVKSFVPAADKVEAAPSGVAAPPVPVDLSKVVFENVYFETGKTSLNEAALKVLTRDLEVFRKYPGIKVEIAGHTEKSGDESLNFKISEDRAKEVKGYFIRNGIEAGNIDISQYGSLMPASSNNTMEGRAKNNRAEIKIKEF